MERVQVKQAVFSTYRFKKKFFGKEYYKYQPMHVHIEHDEIDYLEVDRTKSELFIHYKNGEVDVYTDITWYEPIEDAQLKIADKKMLVLYDGGIRVFAEEVNSLDDVVEVLNSNWEVFQDNKQEARIEIRNL